MDIEVTTTTTVVKHIKLLAPDITELVYRQLGVDRDSVEHARVYVGVPGGGDWSNCKLDLSEECVHVVITFKANSADE